MGLNLTVVEAINIAMHITGNPIAMWTTRFTDVHDICDRNIFRQPDVHSCHGITYSALFSFDPLPPSFLH